MDDISDLAPVTTSTPQDAAANISHGNLFSVDPRYAAQNKPIFDEKASQLLKPQKTEAPVADYMRQSSEHAALAAPDTDKLDFIARQTKMIGDYVFDKPNVQQQIVDLNLKKMNNGGNLSADDEIKLISANQDAQDLEKRDYGISGPIEKIPAMIAGGLSDLGQSVVRGARKGLMDGPFSFRTPGIPGAGLLGNVLYGTMVKDPFDTLSAGTYNELGNLTDDAGKPKDLDHETKLNLSRGVGVVGTALMNVAGYAVAEASPFLKPFINPALAKTIVNSPTKAAIVTSIGGLMKGAAAVGGASGVTEFAKIVGEEIGKAHGTDEAGFWNGLATAVQKIKDNQGGAGSRVLEAAGGGALLGGALEFPLQIAGFGRTKQHFEQGFRNYVENLPPERDVTPQAPAQITGEAPKVPESVIDITPPEIPPGRDNTEEAFKALQLNEALHQVNDVQKTTGMNDISPGELGEVNKRSLLAGGFNKFYTTFSSLRDWASSEAKGKAARDLIDPSGVASGQMNAAVELDPHTVMEIAKQYPDLLDHISHAPDAPTGMQAKEYVEALHRAEEQRTEVMQKLGISPEEVKPPSNVTDLQFPERIPAEKPDFAAAARRTSELLDEKQRLESFPRILEGPDGFMGSIPKAEKLSPIEHKTSGGLDITLSGGGKEQLMESGVTGRELKMHYATAFAKDKKGNIIGSLSVKPEGNGHVAAFVEVDPKHQGKGVASALYQYANAYLAKIEPSEFRTEEGKKFAENFDYGKLDEKSKKMVGGNRIGEVNAELEKLKAEVKTQLTESPPGSVLSFPFDEKRAALNAEMKFGREPTFSDALRTVLPPEQVARFDSSVLQARQHVVNMVHDQAVHEMNKVVDQTTALAKEETLRSELERIANDPNYAIVDKFLSHQVVNAKGKNKRSFYAIDPATLPNDLLHYTDNARLKQHRVFAKGASPLEDSAHALGFQNGRDLLDVLAKTPTREEVIKARSKFYDSDIERLANEHVDLDHTSIMKAFTDKTKAYLETMRYLKDNDWSKTKFGIQKIALPLPRIEEIENDARVAVSKMTVGQLKPSMFVVGERQSYKMAVDKFLAGDLAGAFQAKEMAARNSAVQKEVRKQIGAVNRAQKFARRLEDPTAIAVFNASGKLLRNAKDEILDVFNFNPNKKNQAEQNSFAKWVKRELENGRGDFTIPERLSDVRKSINEMTVEQVLTAEDRLRALFKEAQYKSELMENKDSRDEERSVDRIAQQSTALADAHPQTKASNVQPVQDTKSLAQGMHYFLQDAMSAFSNMEHTLRFYDQGKFNGFFQEHFMHQLKGDGKWDLKTGYSKENAMMHKFAKNAREIMKNHGDYESVEKKILNIPEFKDVVSLGNGQLTKGDLMTMWAYKGDPDGRAYLQSNFRDGEGKGISLETIEKVLDRELEPRDVTAMQYAVDMYKDYQAETADLQMRDKGEQVVFIKGVPNKHRDKYYPGGYVQIKLKHEWTREAARREIEFLEGKKAAWFDGKDGAEYGRQFAAEQTEQGRLERRTGTDKPLDLSLMRFWRGHEEVIHDLSYREPVKNILKLLRDKRISEAMIRMGGEARYGMVVNTVIEMAGRAQATNANYFSDQNRFFKNMFGHLQNNFNVTVLGLNIFTSTPIQYESLTQLVQNMGVKGTYHLGLVNAKMMATPHLWNGYYHFANELDPTIGHFMEQLQNKITSTVHDVIPSKGWTNRIPGANAVSVAHDWAVDKAMAPMALADIHLKVMGAMAAYSQFMSGHAENWPMEKVLDLPEKERHERAQAYVRQVSRLSLTHGRPEDQAVIQKNPLTKFFSNYWNDARNVLNNEIQQAYKVKWNSQQGIKALKSGGSGGGGPKDPKGSGTDGQSRNGGQNDTGYGASAGYFRTAAGIIMSTIVTTTLARWYSDKIRGIQQTPDQWNVNLKTAEGRKDAAERMLFYSLMSPADQWATVNPIVRETFFAEQMPDKVIRGYVDKAKTVQLPITKELSDIATAANTLTDAVQASNNLSDFLFYISNLDNKETKALLNAESYLGIPIPVNAYSHLMRVLELPLNSPAKIGPVAFDRLNQAIGGVLKRTKDIGPDHLELDKDFVGQIEGIQKQIQPQVVEIPSDAGEKIKVAMSGGDWSKPDGIFGFTKDKWSELKKSAPDLGLTDAGRISKNTEQQERAMDYVMHENAQKLSEIDVPVNNESLYGAYRFGPIEYMSIYKAQRSEKLKSVLSEETLKKNPDLVDLKTVGQLRSRLNSELNKGSNKLTSPTATNED